VVLIQVAVPSRENIESYQELTSEVHELIASINGNFGTADWVPLVYMHRGISRSELVALYHIADAGWVSPLRDGMNLVAKEFAACKPDGNGVLILSSFAGAAAEMGEALLVNPYDEERTAWAVERALSMPEPEKHDRMTALHQRVIRNNVFAWGDRFLELLDEAAAQRHRSGGRPPDPLPITEFTAAYRSAPRRLLVLDYDGTLVGLQPRPEAAAPDDELRRLLCKLASDPANEVVIASGRRCADLDRWLGAIPRLFLAAEHGAICRTADAAWQSRNAGSSDWKANVRPILEHYVERVPGSLIEEKDFALVWHYRTAEAEFGDWTAGELTAMLEGMLAETELNVYRGHKIVEIKPVWANKGALVRDLLTVRHDLPFIVAIGDDRTDEDMFAELPDTAWTVRVGPGASKARFCLRDSAAVIGVLRELTSA
jgi:trehalose 6-phosphate synthase/phosphatase